MPGLEIADGNGQVGADAQIRQAAVPVQTAVDVDGDHISAAAVDGFNDLPGRAPDFSPETGAEEAVRNGAVTGKVCSAFPQPDRGAGFFALGEIIRAVFGKLFGQQDQLTGDPGFMQQQGDHIAVSGVVSAAAEDGHRRLPFGAVKDAPAGPEHQLPARSSGGNRCRVAFAHILHRNHSDHLYYPPVTA